MHQIVKLYLPTNIVYTLWILVCCSIATLGTTVSAQSPELFSFQYHFFPEEPVTESNDSIAIGISEIETSIRLPIKLSKKLSLLTGGTFGMIFSRSSQDELETELYFIALETYAIFTLKKNHRLVGVLVPAISSTLQDKLSTEDLLTQASLSYFRDVNNRLNFGVGGLYTSRFGRPQFLPLLAFNYYGANVKYNLTLPLTLQVTWAYEKRLSYGLVISVNGSQYNTSQATRFFTSTIDAIDFSRVLIGPELGIRLKGPLHLTLSGGICTRRVLQLNARGGQDQDLSLDAGAFLTAKFSLKPNIQK